MRASAVSKKPQDDECLIGCTVVLLLLALGSGVGLLFLFSTPKFAHTAFPFPMPKPITVPKHGQIDWTKITTLGSSRCGKNGEFCHEFEFEAQGWKHLLTSSPQGSIFDIGVGNGGFTLLALSLSRQVVTMDPILRNIEHMQTEILTLRKATGSTLFYILPSEKDDDSRMLKVSGSELEIVLKPTIQQIIGKEVLRVATVRIDTLAQFLSHKNIAVLRLNLAGYDGVATRGAAGLLSGGAIKFVVVDVNTKKLLAKSDFSLSEFLHEFHKNGYEIFISCDKGIDSFTRREMPFTCLRFYQLTEYLAGGHASFPPNAVIEPEMFEPLNSLLVKNQRNMDCCVVRVIARRREVPWNVANWWQ